MASEVRMIDMNTLWQCETCFHHYPNGCDTYCDHGESYRPAADQLTVIDPESLRPKGRWVNERVLVGGFNETWGLDCSECGKTVKDHKSNFCPNCGADMRK